MKPRICNIGVMNTRMLFVVYLNVCSRLVTMATKTTFMLYVSGQGATSCCQPQRMGHCVYGVWPVVLS